MNIMNICVVINIPHTYDFLLQVMFHNVLSVERNSLNESSQDHGKDLATTSQPWMDNNW